MAHLIRKFIRVGNATLKERLVIRAFKHNCDMHKFLNTGSNSLQWRETIPTMPEKAGTYVFAGGRYHDVKTLDANVLAHL